MAQLGYQHNEGEYEAATGTPDPLPVGEYDVMIVDSDVGATKAGTGKIAALTYEVAGGQYKGRKIWHRMNIVNPNAQAQEIARKELEAVRLHSGHKGPLNDTAQLHGKMLRVRVKVTQDAGYDAKNEVSKIMPYGSGAAPVEKAEPTSAPASEPQQAAQGTPSWAA